MISASSYRLLRFLLELALLAALTIAVFALLNIVSAQKSAPKGQQAAPPPVAQPLYRQYRGVQLGMTAEQVRQKLGAPKERADRQDFFAFSDAESAQVFYDPQQKVIAITVNYLGEQSGAPTPEQVFGTPAEVKADGSIYKMVRYTQAGYFVVYSRSAGDSPLVMVAMQKIVD
jgi:hypothetical protein